MFNWLIRLGLLLGALACLIDATLPPASREAQVVGHARTITTSSDNGGRTQRSTDYKLGLTGRLNNSCSVDSAAYEVLHDGDTVTVKTTRLFKSCVAVIRDDDKVYAQNYWRLFRFLIAALLIAAFFASFFSNSSGQDDGFDSDDVPSFSRSFTIVDSDSSRSSSD